MGTIYFEAVNVKDTDSTEITVEIATNMYDTAFTDAPTNVMYNVETNGLVYNWQVLTNMPLRAMSSNEYTRFQNTLNYRQASRLRIRRTNKIHDIYTAQGLDNALTAIDNLRISPPPSDVVIRKPEVVFQPGYPSVATNLTIRCYVDNVDTNVPTDYTKRTVTVFYRWRYLDQMVNAWTNRVMTIADTGDGQGNNERYDAILPVQQNVGDLEYYFKCDFLGYRYKPIDATQQGHVYFTNPEQSETLSPREYRGGASEPDGREFYARLRRYKSEYGAVYVVTDQHAEPIEMALVGDEQWRGMVPLGGMEGTNITWYFKGVRRFEPGADDYSTNETYWAEQAQFTVGTVPYGGACIETNSTARNAIAVGAGNYVQMTLNTANLQYMTMSAEYQSFNEWSAREDVFSESSGQASKQRFLNTFDAWDVDREEYFREAVIDYVSTTNVFFREPFETQQRWLAGSAAYSADRLEANYTNKPGGVVGFRNLGIKLKGGDASLGLGYVHTMKATRTDGLKLINFTSRLGQVADNYDISYDYTQFTKQNYLVKADVSVNATSLSPEFPSISLIGYYLNPGNFYEFRATQIADSRNPTTGDDKRVRFEVLKWVDGNPQVLRTVNYGSDLRLTQSMTYEMRMFNIDSTKTIIKCRFGVAPGTGTMNDAVVVTNTASPYQNGTYGLLSADCMAGFSNVRTQNTTTGAEPVSGTEATVLASNNQTLFDTQKLNWYTPAGRFVAKNNVSPYGIYSVAPTQKIGVYLQASDRDSEEEPDAPGTTAWKKFREVTVSDFGYVTNTVAIYGWQAQYVMLQVMGVTTDVARADVVVDELEVYSWRGQQSGETRSSSWLATEAWVVSNTPSLGNVVQLDLTRADTNKAQAVRSLLLTNGMGMLEFDYKVLRAPAKLTVQYAPQDDSEAWVDVQSFATNAAMPSYQHVSAYLGTNAPGYLRVLNERAGIYTNGLVEINNAIAWDEPYVDESSWKVYNAKITNSDKTRVLLDDSRGCYLNNSQTLETDPIQNQSVPYLQSPVLPSGLGALSFLARAYTTNQPAKVSVWASTNGWGASWPGWIQIHEFSNIVSMLYQPYTFKPEDGRKYDAIRLVTGTGSTDRRVCIEEVAIEEPVFPGFDIVDVKALSDYFVEYQTGDERYQPLEGDTVGIEARIANLQLSPSNIQMYVTYYIGTNVWGVQNWPDGQKVTVPMFKTGWDPLVYRTSPTNDIPAQERDQIVQYQVWAMYDGGVRLKTEQETFDTPSWYFPTDLNVTYASKGWSPYYLVYGVPLGAVWINEINAHDTDTTNNGLPSAWQNKYIEIAVPAGLDLAGWSVELVNIYYEKTVIRIPEGLEPLDAVTNGYAFFVIGDDPANVPDYPPLPRVDYEYLGMTELMPFIVPGGIRLLRPMGMYEEAVAYDFQESYGSGIDWAAADPEQRFRYVGIERSGGSLNVTNGTGAVTNDWCFPLYWTPGQPNVGQNVPQADQLLPGSDKVLITSTMNQDNATQNGKRLVYYTFKAPKSTPEHPYSTNIIYQADDWYRLYSIKVDGVERLPSVRQEYQLDLIDIQTNINVDVTLDLREDLLDMELDPAVLNWLLTFDDTDLVTSRYNDRDLTLTELYWLDADPTVTNRVDYRIWDFHLDESTNLNMTLELSLNEANLTHLQGGSVLKIFAKENLMDPEWQMLAQYALSTDSFDDTHTCHLVLRNPFPSLPVEWDLSRLFLRGMIEMEDPRVVVQPLVDMPASP